MRWLQRVARASVWARNGVRPEDWRFRGVFRYVLPATDLLFLYFGVVGAVNGIRSMQDELGGLGQVLWSAGIAVAAFVALVGVSFPKLWLVELCGKIPLIALVAMYVVLVLGRGSNDPLVLASAGLVAILVLLPLWRVGDLGFESWLRDRGRR